MPRFLPSALRLTVAMAALPGLSGCSLAVRHEIGEVKVGLAYSRSCFGLITIDPANQPVLVHLHRTAPVDAWALAADTQIPTEAEARIAADIGVRRQACEEQEAKAMQSSSPSVAATLRGAAAAQDAVYQGLGTRQTRWMEARRQLWYIHDAAAIQVAPMLAELNQANLDRLNTAAVTDQLLGAVLAGAASGAAAGAVYQPHVRSFTRFR